MTADDLVDAPVRDSPERDAAFEREALDCLPHVARFARSLTRNESEADDLTQETFLLAYRGYTTFQPGGNVKRWLFSICHHAWLRTARRQQRMVLTPEGDDAELETMGAVMGHVAAQRSGTDRFISGIDLGPAIRDAVAQLDPNFRAVVQLVDVDGYAYDEAATVLEIPVGTVRSRLFRARRLLQEALLEFARDAGVARVESSPRQDRSS